MTVLESLKGLSGYPISALYLAEVAIRRGLSTEAEVDADTLNGKAFLLAKADIFMWLVLAPSISQGGITFDLTDEQRSYYKSQAQSIYAKYNDTTATSTTVTYGYKGTRL